MHKNHKRKNLSEINSFKMAKIYLKWKKKLSIFKTLFTYLSVIHVDVCIIVSENRVNTVELAFYNMQQIGLIYKDYKMSTVVKSWRHDFL